MSPFDEVRYARLLEGLEAVEVKKSELNEDIRIDSQYFRKRYLYEDACRRHFNSVALGSQAFITDGPHGYHEVDLSSSIAMLTAKCAKQWFADRAQAETISKKTHLSNLRSTLESNDVILSTRGTVGACAIVEPQALPANIDQDVARIALNKGAQISPRYLLAYLNSCFGQDWIERNSTGMVQQGLSLGKVRDLPVPVLSAAFQDKVDEMIRVASGLRQDSDKSLAATEVTLLNALDLDRWKAPDPLTYVRSSRDAFAARRLDAEHFKPKYAELISHIKQSGNAARLGSLLAINDRGNQPEYADEGLPVINSKQVIGNEVRLDSDNRKATADAAKLLIEPGDLLMNGTGVGTIGRSAPYLHTGKAIPDNHVTVLRLKPHALDPIYLGVFINSIAGQMQVEQRQHGSSGQIELYPSDIADFTVWVAPEAIQKEVRHAVEASFASKQRAAQLLDAAKCAVEIAIEHDEKSAMAYLEAQTCQE